LAFVCSLPWAETCTAGMKSSITLQSPVALLQAERCTVEMASLTDELVGAQPALTSAAEAEDAAVAAFACCTPNLLRESAALKQQLAQTLASADSLRLGLPHLYMVTADLRQMSAQVNTL